MEEFDCRSEDHSHDGDIDEPDSLGNHSDNDDAPEDRVAQIGRAPGWSEELIIRIYSDRTEWLNSIEPFEKENPGSRAPKTLYSTRLLF